MKAEKSERELLADISGRLDRIIGLLAVQQNEGDENAKIKQLYDLGLAPSAIGAIMGVSPNAVTIRMTRIRKQGRAQKK